VSYAISGPIWGILKLVKRLFGPEKKQQSTSGGELKTETKTGTAP
jgi:hypothetical protein